MGAKLMPLTFRFLKVSMGRKSALSKEEIEAFGVNALDDISQITDYCPKGVDGVIVAVTHDAFKKMKLEDLARMMNDKPVKEMVKELKDFGVDVYGYDPLLSREEILERFSFSTNLFFKTLTPNHFGEHI
jgi:hypothetical protein